MAYTSSPSLPSSAPAGNSGARGPLRSSDGRASAKFSGNAGLVFDIKIAAGDFSKEQWLQDCLYAALPDYFTAKPGFFLAQVVGESMNRRILNGSWCLFREVSDGTRNGRVVFVQSRDIQDPDTGGQYTVKIYRSEKAVAEDSWAHSRIRLEPDSMDFNFKPLTLEPDTMNALRVIGEFVGIIS